MVTALNGPSPPPNRGQLSSVATDRTVPPPRSQLTALGLNPRPQSPHTLLGPAGPSAPPFSPRGARTDALSVRETERGARAGGREGSLPVATAHLVAEHSWGGGGGSGEGNGGGREEALTLRAPPRAGPPPARDPWPPPYAGACVGTCAGAPRGGRPPHSAPGGGGCAGTDLASRFLVSAAGRRSRGERLRTRHPSGASSRSEPVAPPPASLRPPDAEVRVTSFPSPTGRRKAL